MGCLRMKGGWGFGGSPVRQHFQFFTIQVDERCRTIVRDLSGRVYRMGYLVSPFPHTDLRTYECRQT